MTRRPLHGLTLGALTLLAVGGGPARAQTHAPAAPRATVRTLAEAGRYAEAEAAVKAFQAANPRSAALQRTLGEVLVAQGRRAEAEAAFEAAIAAGAPDALSAETDLALLRLDRGERAAAMAGFARLVQAYNHSARLSSDQLTAVAIACRHLGDDDPQMFKDALKAFDEAIAADPDNVDARVGLVELFLDKYNGKDAAVAAREALERAPGNPRVLLTMARVLDQEGAPGVTEAIEKSLKANPALSDAHVFRAEVLLDQEDAAGAAREAETALATNPASVPAISVLAAARLREGDRPRFEEARRKALALNPRNVELYDRLADASAHNRLYREAADFAQQAVLLDPRAWRGFGILGLNQLRLGRIEEGRKSLEASFAGDPYNVWIKNTLDLLDTFPKYRETKTAHFQILLHGKEADLLAPYVSALAEDAYAHLSERYAYRPPGPVRIEVYPDHADFSVRTVGLAGLAGLGACFGPVLAIDSPSARPVGQFNWGSTLWHELAHTFTLGRTANRVPRWFTEGLSVHEEHRARPGWGDGVTIEFLHALEHGELLPVRDLNRGFVRAKGPEQIGISYYQAALTVEWIEAEHGFPAILTLLDEYGQGRSTAEAFGKVLGTTPEEFDKKFLAHVTERFAGPLASSAAAQAQSAAGMKLFQQGKRAESIPFFERARALFPELGGPDSPHWYLALLYGDQGRTREAVEELRRLDAITDSHYKAHALLAQRLEEQGDIAGAAAALDDALYISPFDPALHEALARLYGRLGDRANVVRARRSLVALDPVDRPEALYQLALALVEAGDAASARREVLHALELAPRFQRAQELLLRLHDAPAGKAAS
jgi:tetratricopeptide (TPR) repeat protein